VKPFPISVAPGFVDNPPTTSRQALLQSLDTQAEFLGVGVERLDYTKGLPERFRALGRFFERFPEYRERVVFVQLAAPSRSTIPRYQALLASISAVGLLRPAGRQVDLLPAPDLPGGAPLGRWPLKAWQQVLEHGHEGLVAKDPA